MNWRVFNMRWTNCQSIRTLGAWFHRYQPQYLPSLKLRFRTWKWNGWKMTIVFPFWGIGLTTDLGRGFYLLSVSGSGVFSSVDGNESRGKFQLSMVWSKPKPRSLRLLRPAPNWGIFVQLPKDDASKNTPKFLRTFTAGQWKNDGWKRTFLFGKAFFQGRTCCEFTANLWVDQLPWSSTPFCWGSIYTLQGFPFIPDKMTMPHGIFDHLYRGYTLPRVVSLWKSILRIHQTRFQSIHPSGCFQK